MAIGFSPTRFWAIVVKEFIQMRRDRLTFGMMIGIPLLQLILFGFAINSDPKNLPTGVIVADHGPHARTILHAIQNSGYFEFVGEFATQSEADAALARGDVLFVVEVPPNFEREMLRGERPALLVEADATDPAATSNAMGSLERILTEALRSELAGARGGLAPETGPVELRVHARYNPEAITQYNIVPGLMGVVLTMTMIMITGLAITRESERGTMENLLSMPTRPFEVMVGKIVPYILVGYIQVGLILLAARYLFEVPMLGNLLWLLAAVFLFIVANLAVGIAFSTVARNQLQALQMSFFFFLPSLLLSGFMFPFRGMPEWAQMLGEALPLTHFLRIVRGILIKGSEVADMVSELWPIAVFTTVALAIGVARYRRTLD